MREKGDTEDKEETDSSLRQWSSTFLTPGNSFVEDNFSTYLVLGLWGRWFQND